LTLQQEISPIWFTMEVPTQSRIVFHFVRMPDMLMLDYNGVNNVFVETLMVNKDKILIVLVVCRVLEITRKLVEMDGETLFTALPVNLQAVLQFRLLLKLWILKEMFGL